MLQWTTLHLLPTESYAPYCAQNLLHRASPPLASSFKVLVVCAIVFSFLSAGGKATACRVAPRIRITETGIERCIILEWMYVWYMMIYKVRSQAIAAIMSVCVTP